MSRKKRKDQKDKDKSQNEGFQRGKYNHRKRKAGYIAKALRNTYTEDPERISRLVDHAQEIFRIEKMIGLLIGKDPFEHKKYVSRYEWFLKKTEEFFGKEGLEFVRYEIGSPYDTGLPVNPLNIGDFNKDDELVIAQVRICNYRNKRVT